MSIEKRDLISADLVECWLRPRDEFPARAVLYLEGSLHGVSALILFLSTHQILISFITFPYYLFPSFYSYFCSSYWLSGISIWEKVPEHFYCFLAMYLFIFNVYLIEEIIFTFIIWVWFKVFLLIQIWDYFHNLCLYFMGEGGLTDRLNI